MKTIADRTFLEEGAGLGDMEYSRPSNRLGKGFEQVTSTLKMDGVGPFTGTTTVTSFAASQAFEKLLEERLSNYPGVVKVEPWPASDLYIFYSNARPSVAFTSKGIRDTYHTFSDTVAWISGKKLAEVIQLVLDLVEMLDNRDLSWSRPKQ